MEVKPRGADREQGRGSARGGGEEDLHPPALWGSPHGLSRCPLGQDALPRGHRTGSVRSRSQRGRGVLGQPLGESSGQERTVPIS